MIQTKINKGFFSCLCCCFFDRESLVKWVSDDSRSRWFSLFFGITLVTELTRNYFLKSISESFDNSIVWILLLVYSLFIFVNNPRSNIWIVLLMIPAILAGLALSGYEYYRSGIALMALNNINSTVPTAMTNRNSSYISNGAGISPQNPFKVISDMTSNFIGITALVVFILFGIVVIFLVFFKGGRYQDFHQKRVKYYRHVQGLFLVRKIINSMPILPSPDIIMKQSLPEIDSNVSEELSTMYHAIEPAVEENNYLLLREDEEQKSIEKNQTISDSDDDTFSLSSTSGTLSEIDENEIFPDESEDSPGQNIIIRIFNLILDRIKKKFLITISKIKKGLRKLTKSKRVLNPYTIFLYPQRFLIGVLSGFYLTFWISITLLIIGIKYLIPIFSIPWNLAIEVCESITTPVNGEILSNNCILDKTTFINLANFGAGFTYFIYIGAPILSLLFILINTILMFREYKFNILNMRKGKYHFNKKNFSTPTAFNYIGKQASFSLAGHIVNTFLLYIIFSAFIITVVVIAFLTLIPKIFEKTIPKILKIVSPTLISYIIITITRAFFFTRKGQWIRFTDLFCYFEIISMFKSYTIGIFAALILRVLLPLLKNFLEFSRLDRSFTLKYAQWDSAYCSYIGALLMDHRNNNPVLSVFIDTLVQAIKSHKTISKTELQQINIQEETLKDIPLSSAVDIKISKTNKLVAHIALLYTLHKNSKLLENRRYKE